MNPSSVVLKRLPPHCTDAEIRRVLMAFGNVLEVQLLHPDQAIVKMQNYQQAQAILTSRIAIRDCFIIVESYQGGYTGQQGGYTGGQQGGYTGGQQGGYTGGQQGAYQHAGVVQSPKFFDVVDQAQPLFESGPSTTLQVTVTGCLYPITKEVLDQVFRMVAPPKAIHCGPSGPTTEGTVEFYDVAAAQNAISQLQGKFIYPNSCTMQLAFAPPQRHYQQAPYGQQQQHQHHNANQGYQQQNQQQHYQQQNQQQHYQQNQQHYQQQISSVPYVPRGRGRAGMPTGSPVRGRGFAPYGVQAPVPDQTNVVLFHGVPLHTSLQQLWILLELYGNVNTLKRQYSHKESVVARFQAVTDAKAAVFFLNNTPYFGRTLMCKLFAGYYESEKTEWNAGPPNDPETMAVDFSSKRHRNKPSSWGSGGKKYRPSPHLFIANLAPDMTDDQLKAVFEGKGFSVLGYSRKFVTSAILTLESVEHAIDALIQLHGLAVSDRYIRVMFSGFAPGSQEDHQSRPEGGSMAALAEEGQGQQLGPSGAEEVAQETTVAEGEGTN